MIVYGQDGSSTAVNYWKQERLVCKKQMNNLANKVLMWSNLHGSQSAPIAEYYGYTIGNANEVSIDLTDYVRTYPTVASIYIQEEGASACTLSISVKGLINPANVIIPPRDINDTFDSLILPPSLILKPIASGAALKLECYDTGTYLAATGRIKIQPSGDVVNMQNARPLQLPSTATSIEMWHLNDDNYKTIALRELDCDKRYAAVKWISLSGVERCSTFEVMKPKTEAVDQFSLMPIDNEYIEVKGRKDGLTLRLDGLSAYDLWYYSDVMFSSNVQVSLDGTAWDRVQVTTKSATQPDGGANNGKLEIAINWKRYDAVAM